MDGADSSPVAHEIHTIECAPVRMAPRRVCMQPKRRCHAWFLLGPLNVFVLEHLGNGGHHSTVVGVTRGAINPVVGGSEPAWWGGTTVLDIVSKPGAGYPDLATAVSPHHQTPSLGEHSV